MKELSLNILDIAENSVKASATLITIEIAEDEETLSLSVEDDGTGMKEDFLAAVTDPFTTTRTTRNVGLGIPLLKMEAEMTGGSFSIVSRHISDFPDSHGTKTSASFFKNHLDMTPLGDIVSTVVALIQCNPDLNFVFHHQLPGREIALDTRELRSVLGEEVPLNNADVIVWIKEYLSEQYSD